MSARHATLCAAFSTALGNRSPAVFSLSAWRSSRLNPFCAPINPPLDSCTGLHIQPSVHPEHSDSRAEHPERAKLESSRQTAQEIESSLRAAEAFGDEEEFLRLIEPLEVAADRALDGMAREKARKAWQTYPRGFEVVARRAFNQATRNPVGLLLWMLDRHHHEAADRALDRAAAVEPKQQGECFVCSTAGEVFSYAGQWFCAQHRDEQEVFDGGVTL
jgi:hypothetical protein